MEQKKEFVTLEEVWQLVDIFNGVIQDHWPAYLEKCTVFGKQCHWENTPITAVP